MLDVPLHALTATHASRRMRAGELSPIALVEAILDRIESLDPILQAWVSLDAQGSVNAARAAEKAFKDGAAGPLCGVPIAVKDLIHVRGLPTGANFEPFQGQVQESDAACIAKLRSAGAIIVGKVMTTQFAGRDPSPTRNPWDFSRTASGSSSGSAVSVAARMVPASIATQTGGSIIRPAAYLGVVGFSPTYGRVSRAGLLPRSFSFDTIGAMSRSVDDVELLFGVMSGPDPRDMTTSGLHGPKHAGPAPGDAIRLTVIEDLVAIATPESKTQFETTIDRLTSHGAHIKRARLPVALEALVAIHTLILLSEAAATQSVLLPRYREKYSRGLRAQFELGNAIPSRAYIQAQRLRRRARDRLTELLSDADALVLPSMPSAAPDRTTIGPLFCQVPWTIMGWPSITLPTGLDSDRQPVGLQLVAAPFAESALFVVARWVEDVLDPMPPPPEVTLVPVNSRA